MLDFGRDARIKRGSVAGKPGLRYPANVNEESVLKRLHRQGCWKSQVSLRLD